MKWDFAVGSDNGEWRGGAYVFVSRDGLGEKGNSQCCRCRAELFLFSSFFSLSVCVNWKVSEADAWVGEREGGLELNLKACAKMDEPRCERKSS